MMKPRAETGSSIANSLIAPGKAGETNIVCFTGKGVYMKKLRHYFAVIALLAALGGFSFQGMVSMANAAANAAFAAGHATHSVAVRRTPPCPSGGTIDC